MSLAALLLAVVIPAPAQELEKAFAAASAAAAAPKPAARPAPPRNETTARFQQKAFPLPADGACALKRFTLEDYVHSSSAGEFDRSRISVMGAVIETTAPACLRDFAVVQFIRGCVWHDRYELPSLALKERVHDVARWYRGKRVVFSHPDFEVDRTDEDPVYASDPDADGRVGMSYVPKRPLRLRPDRASLMSDLRAFDRPDEREFLQDSAPTTLAFVTDVPDGGVTILAEDAGALTAANSSLDFLTCVYRIADVPESGEMAPAPAAGAAGRPLACFTWHSRHVYDPASREFRGEASGGPDPFCAQAPPKTPLPGSGD